MKNSIEITQHAKKDLWSMALAAGYIRTRLMRFGKIYTSYLYPSFLLVFINLGNIDTAKSIVRGDFTLPLDWWTFLFGVFFVVEILFIWINRSLKVYDPVHAVYALSVAEEKLIYSKNRIELSQKYFEILYVTIENSKKFLLSKDGCCDIEKFEEVLEYVFDSFLLYVRELFGYEKYALYNFSIYIYDEVNNSLICVFRNRSKRLERERPTESRSWPIGVGHVGECYALNEPLKVNDISQNENFKKKHYIHGDERYYRSVISVPLEELAKADNGTLTSTSFGVMILTSNQPDQFGEHDLESIKFLKLATEELINVLWKEVMANEKKNIENTRHSEACSP